jgi:hypothetical protein
MMAGGPDATCDGAVGWKIVSALPWGYGRFGWSERVRIPSGRITKPALRLNTYEERTSEQAGRGAPGSIDPAYHAVLPPSRRSAVASGDSRREPGRFIR